MNSTECQDTIPTFDARNADKRVCVIGLGYIGLPTASIVAGAGYQVIGVDVHRDIVDTVNRGEIHIHEPWLEERVASVVNDGNLHASSTPTEADVFIICVPTPITKDKRPNLAFVEKASKAIQPLVRAGNLVLLESTSPPGTTEGIVATHAIPPGLTVGRDVFVAHSPERVLPGRILFEILHNDRIVGGITDECTARAKQFYESFVSGTVWPTSAVAAEITKLVENASRDVNIAFANEISMLADHFDADPLEIIDLANKHPRVNILQPGPGVGGHCIGVDPWFLIDARPDDTLLMRAARKVNDSKPLYLVEQVAQLLKTKPNAVVGCLGLAYKADVDDLRGSPAMTIVRELHRRNLGEVLVHDPFVFSDRFEEFPLSSLGEVLRRSDVLLLLTDHHEFRSIPVEMLRNKVVLDTRGMWREALSTPPGEQSMTFDPLQKKVA
jgi:UDP-N-acetyl-D-mannosaminuronic acid dehydrogenase